MDWASLAGFVLAIAAILFGQSLEGGRADSLFQAPALVIVLVGTVGAVMLQNGLKTFLRGAAMARWIVVTPTMQPLSLKQDVAVWSATARREGLLSLERYVESLKDPFMVKGMRMVVDGIDPYKMREILETDIDSYERRERQAAKIWEAAGGYAPTIGILGAVLGLIHVMENLTEPAKLGGGIAVAFVATIYGVGLANLVFLPVANKLKNLIAVEVRRREMLTDIFCGIAAGDNGRVLEERMAAYH